MAETPSHRFPVRVYYEDTDAGGIVYHSAYLRFAERGRTEWMRDLGYDHTTLRDAYGAGFTVSRCEIDYRKPALRKMRFQWPSKTRHRFRPGA